MHLQFHNVCAAGSLDTIAFRKYASTQHVSLFFQIHNVIRYMNTLVYSDTSWHIQLLSQDSLIVQLYSLDTPVLLFI